MAHPSGSLPAPSRPGMTFEEFLRSPYRRAEWVNGEVLELSPENLEHSTIGGFLYALLAFFVTVGLPCFERGLWPPGEWSMVASSGCPRARRCAHHRSLSGAARR